MSFITLRPSLTKATGYLGDKVRIAFPTVISKKNHEELKRMVMYIGKDVAKKFGFTKDDRVLIQVDEDNRLIWHIVKDDSGWKLIEAGSTLTLQISWKFNDVVKDWGKDFKYVNVSLVDGKMQLTLPGASKTK